MSDNTAISERITAFLAGGQTRSDGGFAPVTPKELEQLHDIIGALIAAKYEADPDGDLPVEVILTDRTRYERPFTSAIPYTHKPFPNHSEVELELLVADRFQGLANFASERASRHLRAATELMRVAATANRPMTFSGVTYSVALPPGMTRERICEVLDTEVRNAMLTAPCPQDFTERGKWAEQRAQAATAVLGMKVLPRTCSHGPDGVKIRFDIPALDDTVKIEAPHAK